jgi:hypothetical protein
MYYFILLFIQILEARQQFNDGSSGPPVEDIAAAKAVDAGTLAKVLMERFGEPCSRAKENRRISGLPGLGPSGIVDVKVHVDKMETDAPPPSYAAGIGSSEGRKKSNRKSRPKSNTPGGTTRSAIPTFAGKSRHNLVMRQ